MPNKKSFRHIIGVFFLIIFALGPIIWCFIISLTPEHEMLKSGENIMPSKIVSSNYEKVLNINEKEGKVIANGMKNALKISIITIIIGIPITFVTGYVFARYDFRFKKALQFILYLTIIIPVFTTIIPIYNIFVKMNLLDSMAATAVIYISSFLPINVSIVMNYIKELPEELFEAAKVDGFSDFEIFYKIVLPISRPIIITITLIFFLSAWKQYIIPTILLTSYDNRVITKVMGEFMTRDGINYGLIAASGILAIIPPAVFAAVFRKYIINGLTGRTEC